MIDQRLPSADPACEKYQIGRLRALAKKADLDREFAEKYLSFVTREAICQHESVRQDAAGVREGGDHA